MAELTLSRLIPASYILGRSAEGTDHMGWREEKVAELQKSISTMRADIAALTDGTHQIFEQDARTEQRDNLSVSLIDHYKKAIKELKAAIFLLEGKET
jgi:hypothetical protein